MASYQVISTDTECSGLHSQYGAAPFLFTFCDENLKTSHVEFPVNPFTRKVKYNQAGKLEIKKKLAGKKVVFHHAKFDINMFAVAGLHIDIPQWRDACLPINFTNRDGIDIEVDSIEDTANASHICYSDEQHALKYLAFRYLDIPDDDEKDVQKAVNAARAEGRKRGWKLGTNYKGESEPKFDYWMPKALNPKCKKALTYGLLDAKRTLLLYYLMDDVMDKDKCLRKSYEEEMDLVGEIYAMERMGITYSNKNLSTLTKFINAQVGPNQEIVERIGKKRHSPTFNHRSGPQVQQLLYGYSVHSGKKTEFANSFSLPVIKLTEANAPSTDKEVIPKLIKYCEKKPKTYKIPLEFLRAKQAMAKFIKGGEALASYKKAALPHESNSRLSKLQFSINQNGTKLTRVSSSDPFNSQNVSAKAEVKVRSVFAPNKNCWWYSIDGSQLELVILAYASQDQRMLQAVEEGEDFHDMVMKELFLKESKTNRDEARKKAKAVNFRITYGGGAEAIDSVGGPGTYDRFASRFPGLPAYMAKAIAQCRRLGYVETLSGRRLYVDRRRAKTRAVNAVVQGTAGEWAKFCMRRISKKKLVDWKTSRIVLQIHDELILEYPKTTPLSRIRKVCTEMKRAAIDLNFSVNVDVKVIKNNWAEKEPVEL